MDRDKMSNSHREPSIDASYHVSVHLPKLLMDQDEMRIFIEDRPQMISTKFWFIWPSGFRGEEFKKSANQKQESPVAAMFANGWPIGTK